MFNLKTIDWKRREVAQPVSDAAPADEAFVTTEAELRAILVDLEARARYGRIEGVAVPLLVHAKTVNDDARRRLTFASTPTRERFEPRFVHLTGQLRTVGLAIAHLCRADFRANDPMEAC